MLFSACSQKVEIDYDLLADKITERLQNTHPEQPTELERVITNPSNGHGYLLISKPMEWREAKEYAERMGGHLATITSQEEQDWICQTFPVTRSSWIGGTDEDVEGEWRWVTGEEWDYTNWAPGAPNNVDLMRDGEGEDALTIHLPSDLWNDLPTDAIIARFIPTSLLVEFDSPNDPK